MKFNPEWWVRIRINTYRYLVLVDWIRIGGIGNADPDLEKITTKIEKSEEIICFEVVGRKSSLVAWTSFMEALEEKFQDSFFPL